MTFEFKRNEFRTKWPFCINGELEVLRAGFARIPVVQLQVLCERKDLHQLVLPIKNFILDELEANGVSSDVVEQLKIETSRRNVMFYDCNELSPTKGDMKRGIITTWRYTIKDNCLDCFEWKSPFSVKGKFREHIPRSQ